VLARLQKRRREETGLAGMGRALCVDPEAASGGEFWQSLKCCDSITATSNKPQATSRKLQA